MNISDRFMSMFAEQGGNNSVTGIDAEGLIQRLLLFDHCIIASVWLKDVHRLLRIALDVEYAGTFRNPTDRVKPASAAPIAIKPR